VESLVEFLGSSHFSLQGSELLVEFIPELISGSASSTEGEDHFPESALNSSSLLLQSFNVYLFLLDSLGELVLDIKENFVEVISSSGAVLLELDQNSNDGISFLELSGKIILLVFDFEFPDFGISNWLQSVAIEVSLSEFEFFIGSSEVILSGGGHKLNILNLICKIEVMNFQVLSQFSDDFVLIWEHLFDFSGKLSAISEVFGNFFWLDGTISGLFTEFNVLRKLF
jgi:hypothetical protein